MIKYKIRLSKTKKPYPIIEFSNRENAPIGSFLLAERAMISQIISVLTAESEEADAPLSISGNVYTLTVDGDNSTITDDIAESDFVCPTQDLREIAMAYKAAIPQKTRTAAPKPPLEDTNNR